MLAISVPQIINQAKEWVEILHYRILNHPPTRLSYGKVLSRLDEETKGEIVKLLNEIKEEGIDKFGKPIDEIIMAGNGL